MGNELVEEIVFEVCEEYKKEIPTGIKYIDEEMLKLQLEKSVKGKFPNQLDIIDRETLYNTAWAQCAHIILIALFSCVNDKLSYEKSLERFLGNVFLDPKMYDFLMANMVEFQMLNASLSEKNRKRFTRARNARKTADIISAIRSLGITAIIDGVSFSKRSKEFIGNPLFRDVVVMIKLSGVLSND